MAKPYSSFNDGPSPPDWETAIEGRYLEVWWDYEIDITLIGTIEFSGYTIEFRDTEARDFLGIPYQVPLEKCNIYVDGENIGPYLNFDYVVPEYRDEYNLTLTVLGNYISANIILRGNSSMTLGDSWDAGVMDYSINYEIDFEAMKPSAFVLIGQLLTFNNPDFGIPGLFGEIIGYVLSLGIWAVILIISYTVITKLIPTIQGGIEN